MSKRTQAPFGARACGVVARRETGGYVVFTALDDVGPDPEPGQFYMLSADRWGERGGRPYLPRAFSVAAAERGTDGMRLEFLLEAVGPGTSLLAELEEGDRVSITGPLGRPFSAPGEVTPGAAGALLVGGGIGIAPIAMLRKRLSSQGVPLRTLLGFRDEAHSGGFELFGACQELGIATEDGYRGHRGRVTDLIDVALKGDSASTAAIYACGPPAMLEAVRVMAAERGAGVELAMEAPMACGYGACFGCAVPLASGGYMRLCVDGPVVRGDEIESALIAGSGHR